MGEVISILGEITMTQFAQKTPRRITLPDYLIITQAKMNRVRKESDNGSIERSADALLAMVDGLQMKGVNASGRTTRTGFVDELLINPGKSF
jgi:hypothetical protein